MSEKVCKFRSLLLETLECRSLFSVDGLEFWQCSHASLSFDVDPSQPGQYPPAEAAKLDRDSSWAAKVERSNDFDGVKYYERRSRGSSAFGSSMHRGRFDNAPLPPAESEGASIGGPKDAFDTKPGLDSRLSLDSRPGLDLRPILDSKSVQSPTQAIDPGIILVINSVLTQSRDVGPASIPARTQVESRSAERIENLQASNSTSNNSVERVSPSFLQDSRFNSQGLISAVPISSTATQVAFSSGSSSALSAQASGVTTLDFSWNISSGSEQSPWGDDFRFTRPLPVPAPSDALVDGALVEHASLESLENLLSGLAENHRRNRIQNGFDANQSNSRNEQNWRPETSTSVEVTFADGGMIALALNRDLALSELEEILDDARSENKAWVANVGIFRAFENGAVAATEYAGLTNRTTRNGGSSSTEQELSGAEAEVANSHFHPLLASTSAALGVVMLGLRRMSRKSIPLLFTSRKR
jgi:hypothetical protein